MVVLDTVTNLGAPFAAEKLIRRFLSPQHPGGPALVVLLSNTKHCTLEFDTSRFESHLVHMCNPCLQVRHVLCQGLSPS